MFELLITESFAQELKKLEAVDKERIKKKLLSTLNEPFCYWGRLSGCELFRLRIGSYRVIAQINLVDKRITLLSVWHRRNVYDKL